MIPGLGRLGTAVAAAVGVLGLSLGAAVYVPAQEAPAQEKAEVEKAPQRETVELEPITAQPKPEGAAAKAITPVPLPEAAAPVVGAGGVDRQLVPLEAALSSFEPPAVRSVIQKVNRGGTARASFTGFARRALTRRLQQADAPEVQPVAAALRAGQPPTVALNNLTEEQVQSVASITIDALSGTRPPDDLKDQIKQQNQRARAVLATLPVGVRAARGPRLPSPTDRRFNWTQRGVIIQNSGIVTAVRDQSVPQNCGCCWAFATIGAIESAFAKNKQQLIGASEQYLLNCARFGLPSSSVPYSCDGGWWAFDMLMADRVTLPGVPRRADLLYTGVQGDCDGRINKPYQLRTWGYVHQSANPNEIPTNAEIKAALCQYGPVVCAVGIQDDNTWFFYDGQSTLAEFPNNPSQGVRHAILLVGWDDTRDNNRGAWLFKNSWGTDWGVSGFGYVRYNMNNVGWGAAWALPR
jgi:C1A family cysteine protease